RVRPDQRPVPRRVQSSGVRLHRHDRGRPQGPQRDRRTEGRRRRGQPDRGARGDHARRRQRRAHPGLRHARTPEDRVMADPIVKPVTRTRRAGEKVSRTVGDSFSQAGDLLTFAVRALGSVLYTLRHYRAEVMRQLNDISWGSGALIVGGGTIGVMVLLSLSAGTSLGIEGFNGLELVGLAPLTGFVSASVNTRELAPLIAALALAAQVGCRFTAQLGSMRIHEEIDALGVMGVNPLRYLVTTRVIASMVAILPLYLIGLLGSYIASELSVVVFFGQSAGLYDHYFQT